MMNNGLPLLETLNLLAGYASGGKTAPVTGPLSVEIHAGQLICLLGPNGSGKSTLMRTLAGLQPILEGTIKIAGTDAAKLNTSQLAKNISLVLTDPVRSSNLTVYSLVALGRYPYSNWLGVLSDADKATIAWAIEATHIETFLDRKVATLSDGECQKVMLARALAQDAPLLMLDEPTAHLDLPSRIQLMRLLHQLARETRKGILLSTHELDLALQVADEVWLLQAEPRIKAGKNLITGEGMNNTAVKSNAAMKYNAAAKLNKGAPEDLVLNGVFETAFEKEGIVFDKTTGTFNMHEGNEKYITITGYGVPAFWTKKALHRRGYTVTDLGLTASNIQVLEENGRPYWILEHDGHAQKHETIASLVEALDTQKNK
jgi:iron complex transport system ATP-binding protein